MRAIGGVWKWVKPYRGYAALAMLGSFASVLINLTIPLQTARVIDKGILANDGALVRQAVLTMVGLIVAGMAMSAFTSAMAVRVAFNTVTDLRRDLYGHAQSFSFGNLDRFSSGELLTRLTSDISKITMILTMGLSFISQTPVMFFGALLAIVAIDASLVVIVIVMVPIIGVIVWYTLARSSVLYDAVQTRLDRMNVVLQENIHGAEVIKAFVRQDHETERFDTVVDDFADHSIAVNQLVASLMPTLIALSSFGVAAVLWLGGNNVIQGDLTEGNLVAFISYLAMVAMPMMMFAFIQPILSAAGASMTRIQQVLDEVPDVTDRSDGGARRELAALDEPGDIRFENVSFRYPIRHGRVDVEAPAAAETDSVTAEQWALFDIKLHIPQGQTVAVLGATGSGKSTLVHLIPRLYDATTGTVSVGGVDVKELDKSSLRQNVGIALQQPELFSGTVAENLRYGRPDATDDEVVAAAKAAQAHDFVTALPEGYDSPIEQAGANLSGGQRQRLAIARTLILDPAIIILDDSTSAVDLDTEARIQEALAAYEDRTVVLVAQRISTALGADVIVVLDEGRISAHGIHEDLLETSSIYQEIFRSQLGEPVGGGAP